MAEDANRAQKHEHGGGLDVAMARFGGTREAWLDLSTGINPEPYPVGDLSSHAWTALPDSAAYDRLVRAARQFWNVPEDAVIVPAPGASALIAKMPALTDHAGTYIPTPTYNEHAASFDAHAKSVETAEAGQPNHVYVHPNNPDGRLWPAEAMGGRPLTIIDESFCDVMPEASHIELAANDGIVILKSFGKFWGLAGLRLGFAIGTERTFAAGEATLQDHLGPWAVSGPALEIGARALEDEAWANATRQRLSRDAARLDDLMSGAGAKALGGTDLFRLYEVPDAVALQEALCAEHILTRTFSYSKTWIRLGLPPADRWPQLEQALGTAGGVIRAGKASRGNAAPSPKS